MVKKRAYLTKRWKFKPHKADMEKDNPEAKSLYDLYRHLNLPVDLIQTSEGFTILNLKDVGFEVPYQSPSFRPDYFSFYKKRNWKIYH